MGCSPLDVKGSIAVHLRCDGGEYAVPVGIHIREPNEINEMLPPREAGFYRKLPIPHQTLSNPHPTAAVPIGREGHTKAQRHEGRAKKSGHEGNFDEML